MRVVIVGVGVSELFDEQVLDMSLKLKEIFNKAKRDPRSQLYCAFGAIATHLLNPEASIEESFSSVDLNEPPAELAEFFWNGKLSDQAEKAFRLLATRNSNDPESWSSFMETMERLG